MPSEQRAKIEARSDTRILLLNNSVRVCFLGLVFNYCILLDKLESCTLLQLWSPIAKSLKSVGIFMVDILRRDALTEHIAKLMLLIQMQYIYIYIIYIIYIYILYIYIIYSRQREHSSGNEFRVRCVSTKRDALRFRILWLSAYLRSSFHDDT